MARPSIVPIALTLDDRTGYTLWAPPWEEDGEEWQAFLGTTEGDTATVHLFPTPAKLAAFCRTRTDHDLADHPVWPVVAGLGAADLTPDDDHRYDLDGVYDIAAENPDRWAVEELAATVDIVSRLAECLDTTDEDDDEEQFEAVAEFAAKPEIGSLGLGVEAFAGRSGEDAWIGVGSVFDELWEDVVEELSDHFDWTGGGTAAVEEYPSASESGDDEAVEDDDLPEQADVAAAEPAGATAAPASGGPGVSTIARGSRVTASPAAVAAAAEFWEAVGILPVEIVVPEGAGVTLRCYVDDVARFLGRDGEVFLFDTPADLARFCASDERHDLVEIASWPEVADTDTPPLPAEQDRYDLTELSEVLAEVADGATGLVPHRALVQPAEGARDLAEHAGLTRVEELLAPTAPLGRALARADHQPEEPLDAAEAARLRTDWDEVVTAVGGVLVHRD
ncbi:hypothetical protein E9549_16985 [Blastococcus sp. MG754426]|uniref:hypothetical protein n=1 Tax=unclassified Blastococcus TaxID=2619396 RepID=UPI001EF10A04|nr:MULTISPECIES: hypothetical protein [unclassified Blastococcus]MCF6509083.1 hypothetical protein [Blastococcus sp. MG754426]MCF6513701.1 hypothetical protein [Blastococcus sp. MG754427]MCF6736540.1 hypothetical protein [Blastococcus sp. KM273129]